MTGDRSPLTDAEADALLAPLGRFRTLVLAVSGGADSSALMQLAHGWSRRRGTAAPSLVVATVDHGLRRASADEARVVAQRAHTLGIEHRILVWDGEKPSTGVQAAARAARRRLLAEMAIELDRSGAGPVGVVTAHTADDQAETLVMRLARGSGVDGLAAIPSEGALDVVDLICGRVSIPVLRPLLGVQHARLVATLEAAGIGFANDPSNQDRRFERTRVREALRVLEQLGLSGAALARTAARMRSAQRALDEAADALSARALTVVLGIVREIDRDELRDAPRETAVRLLRRCLAATGGAAPRAELGAIEDAMWRITSAGDELTFTLGGCLVDIVRAGRGRAGVVRILREPDRDGGLPRLWLQPGASAVWDARFGVLVRDGHPGLVEVGPLGPDWTHLTSTYRVLAGLPVPGAAARGVPAFRVDGRLAAVPLLAEFAMAQGDRGAALALAGPCSGASGGDPVLDAHMRAIALER